MHECPELKQRQYEIHVPEAATRFRGDGDNYLYDTRTHTYVFHINYCPFCGEEL